MENSKNASEGISSCYVFKSRLQEYAQKMCFLTPVYETTKEGPSHEPSFKSTVILNNVRYDSLPGFFNRKAAEQSAAEVALTELAKAGEINQSISVPVHETGLCKNLLQEYAQKMNYAFPSYKCAKDESLGRVALFSCTVDIGGIMYIGASARTKKEAEIKAARTALLAISCSSEPAPRNTRLTVVPGRKRSVESNISTEANKNLPNAKRRHFDEKKSGTGLPVSEGNPEASTVVWPIGLPYIPNAVQQPPVTPPDRLPSMNSNDRPRTQSTCTPKLNPLEFPLQPSITNVEQPLAMIPPGQLSCMNPYNGSMMKGFFPAEFSPAVPYMASVMQQPAAIPLDHQPNTNSLNRLTTEICSSQPNLVANVTAPQVTVSQDLRPPPDADYSDGLKPNC